MFEEKATGAKLHMLFTLLGNEVSLNLPRPFNFSYFLFGSKSFRSSVVSLDVQNSGSEKSDPP